MPLTVESFARTANSAFFSFKDVSVGRNGETRLGNLLFSAGKAKNNAVMSAFKAALENEYGAIGTHAFDTVLGSRSQFGKSLRACDVQKTLSVLPEIRKTRFASELNRQFDASPKILMMSEGDRERVKEKIQADPCGKLDLRTLARPADVTAAAAKRLAAIVEQVRAESKGLEEHDFEAGAGTETPLRPDEAAGLKNLKLAMAAGSSSVEDRIKSGALGAGMRVNGAETNPVLLEKLKTNGVEPGFIYKCDWSRDDTRGMMADIDSEASATALEELKARNPQFAADCEGKTRREQLMLAGRAHPAGIAAVVEFALEEAAKEALKPEIAQDHPFRDLAKAVKSHFSEADVRLLAGEAGGAGGAKLRAGVAKEAKLELFAQIRDAVAGVKPGSAIHAMSPVFKHFSDRHIMKLDYNEGDRTWFGGAGASGEFMRPERILATRKPILGRIYRLQTAATADSISSGAVTEALANDLARIAGVPSQELSIVRGQYSDGHPKLMLEAKFAAGYKDMEAGFIKDGRIVKPENAPAGESAPEKLGKYKAFFLLTADRDAVGRRGQNKGFAGGRFFAIDPGHSLEGNAKYLKIADDLSFKDTYGFSTKPRFENFSVFDDDTRFAKFQGLLGLREKARSGEFDKLFADYRNTFDPAAEGISPAEKTLRQAIVADIDKKQLEFNQSLAKLMDTGAVQFDLWDDLEGCGDAVRQGAIENLANLEKLTSATTWVSKKGKVALEHLEVKPETRVPWKAYALDDKIVYFCDKRLSGETHNLLKAVADASGARLEADESGIVRFIVPKATAESVFSRFDEAHVARLTHPEEAAARLAGEDPLKVAKDWKPKPFVKPKDPRPPLKAADLPDMIDFDAGGKVVRMPKIHYEALATTQSGTSRPRTVGELRSLLAGRVRRGNEIVNALLAGRTTLFEPTKDNIVALTHALHAAALKKGEFMYRGSFSIEDPDGHIARWLDKAGDVYLRTSTHAKPYQKHTVDGHLNMPRGYDVAPGAGGLLNGMRTFHYFTVPDMDHLGDAGGSGPRRRLFLKCETFGIFCSTAQLQPFSMAAAKGKDMKVRGYRRGDEIESFKHMASLFVSFFTPKEAAGIRKENMTEAQKTAISAAQTRLRGAGLARIADELVANDVRSGGGVRQLVANLERIAGMLPEDGQQRADALDVLDNLLGAFETSGSSAGGEISKRIGNEIMLDRRDFAFAI